MRVVVFVKATADSERGAMPTPELTEAMGRYNTLLIENGIMLSGDGLTPSSSGKRVLFDGEDRTVTDGPVTETKEIVAGFWIWNVKDMDEALAWVKRCPNPMPTKSEIEIRPILDFEEAFAEVLTPELRALHESNREKLGGG